MDIQAEIEKVSYYPQMCEPLPVFRIEDFKSGRAFKHGRFLWEYSAQESFAISHWTSPKRTWTYPYGRIYDTLNVDNRITIIPFVKDEGIDGDRDFLQWDTVSLMSLLKVYVILAFYKTARKSSRNPIELCLVKETTMRSGDRAAEMNDAGHPGVEDFCPLIPPCPLLPRNGGEGGNRVG